MASKMGWNRGFGTEEDDGHNTLEEEEVDNDQDEDPSELPLLSGLPHLLL